MVEQPTSPTPGGRASFAQDFRRFFLRGLALILPPILTVLILLYLWDVLNRKVGEPTNYLIRMAAAWIIQDSRPDRPENVQDQWVGLVRNRTGQEVAPFVPRADYQVVREKTPGTEKPPETVVSFYERYLFYEYW